VTGLDRRLERWVVLHRAGWLDSLFVALTRAGSYGAIWLALALVLAARRRRWQMLLLVALADLAAEGGADLIKALVGRRRPPLVYPSPKPLVHDPHSSAFPSGHAATSFACATVLAFALPRAAPAFYVLAAAVAFSRVYVGVHWPADVIAGAALGLCVSVALLTVLRRRVEGRSRSSRARRAG
jgi:undecaprenyl-diphosphatase